jgi:hypothetical protein
MTSRRCPSNNNLNELSRARLVSTGRAENITGCTGPKIQTGWSGHCEELAETGRAGPGRAHQQSDRAHLNFKLLIPSWIGSSLQLFHLPVACYRSHRPSSPYHTRITIDDGWEVWNWYSGHALVYQAIHTFYLNCSPDDLDLNVSLSATFVSYQRIRFYSLTANSDTRTCSSLHSQ